MSFALHEMRRRPGRFVVATAILALISLLLLFLGGLLDGLTAGATGALRAQQADLVVYSATAQDSLLRSRIPAEVRQTVEAVPGVTRTGGLGVTQLGARVPGRGPRELVDVAVFGYELAPRGVPDPPADGQAWADDRLRNEGVAEGTELLVGPARTPVRVVGFVTDTAYTGSATLWASEATWRAVTDANRPDTRLATNAFPALVVQSDDPAGTAARIDAATGGATRTRTLDEAIWALPGVAQQTSTFNQIIGVTVVVAFVVVSLFFALLVVERTALYGVLKAMGARTIALFVAVVIQAAAVAAVASLVAGALALVLDRTLPPGSLPYELTGGRLTASVAVVVAASVLGCVTSLRRVLRIDPASAIGSAS
jgi:putative ABC transport system permease protein